APSGERGRRQKTRASPHPSGRGTILPATGYAPDPVSPKPAYAPPRLAPVPGTRRADMGDRTWRLTRHLGGLLAPDDADADLLGRFAAGRDAEAFAVLVRRHGPMVAGVCRRVLRDP